MTRPKIFLSSALADVAWARDFAASLRRQGVDVYDEQAAEAVGVPWDQIEGEVREHLEESDLVALLVSPAAPRLATALLYYGAAAMAKKRIVLVAPEDVDPGQLFLPLRDRTHLTQRSPDETAESLLASTLYQPSA